MDCVDSFLALCLSSLIGSFSNLMPDSKFLLTCCRCTYLYDTLRPKLIHEANLDVLCEIVDILKVEVLGEQLSRRGESLAGLRPTFERILADVHERLTFRARTHIRDEVTTLCECFKWFGTFQPVLLAQHLLAFISLRDRDRDRDLIL